MEPLLIYSPKQSNRLQFVLDWVFGERLKTVYKLTHNADEIASAARGIFYGHISVNSLSIPDAGLLWENNIMAHNIVWGHWNELPTLYAQDNSGFTLPFDIFSAIFFLISRYEEYYSFTPDKHGRYPATESLLYKNGLLQRPVIDEWLQQLRKLLAESFDIKTPAPAFSFQPTYDIDIAWSYKNKGALRSIGAAAKNIVSGNFDQFKERNSVLSGKQSDPYDSYNFIEQLHTSYNLHPIFFILSAQETTAFDKNISPDVAEMRSLIQHLGAGSTIGIHPSYYTDKKKGLLKKEKAALENIIGKNITVSRQHYIKLQLPDTYRLLMDLGITEDHSMGYGTHLGFRAGTSQPFLWFDLENNIATSLRVFPFCFMDTTAHYEQRLSATEAFIVLEKLSGQLQACGGMLITIFHNFSLGTDGEWRGWPELYSGFIAKRAKLIS